MKPYPAYKDSGIEWIGQIPEHWEIKKLKFLISQNDGGVWGEEPERHATIVLRSTELNLDGSWSLDNPAMRKLTESDLKKSLLKKGDILITKSSGSELHIGKSALVDDTIENMKCCYSNFMQRIRPFNNQNSKYLHYILNSNVAREQYNYLSNTTTGLANLTANTLNEIVLPSVPLREQEAIVTYLNKTSNNIEMLVKMKHKQIELLKEERTAIINQAVTKGLNPDVPMKDSGIEWLGEVPEHWNVTVAKHLSDIFIPQRNKPELNDVEGIPWVTLECIGDTFVRHTQFFVRAQDAKISGSRILPTGSVIASCVGRFGIASITTEPVIINQQIQAYIIKHDILPMFLRHYIESSKIYFEMEGNSTTLAYVDREAFGSLPIAVPPIIEQKVIIEVVNVQMNKMSQLIEKLQQEITFLQEYRTALISNAVTGKIDVRDTATAILE
jgi:type I restriction enzyme S subunit